MYPYGHHLLPVRRRQKASSDIGGTAACRLIRSPDALFLMPPGVSIAILQPFYCIVNNSVAANLQPPFYHRFSSRIVLILSRRYGIMDLPILRERCFESSRLLDGRVDALLFAEFFIQFPPEPFNSALATFLEFSVKSLSFASIYHKDKLFHLLPTLSKILGPTFG